MIHTLEDEVILFANEAFYAAFAAGDAEAMDALWAWQSPCACLHPGAPPIMNREEIMMSWEHIFSENGVSSISMHTAKVIASGDVALVVCIEALGGGVLIYLRTGFVGVPLEDFESQSREDQRRSQWLEVGVGAQILRDLGLSKIRLIAGRNVDYVGVEGFGLTLVDTEML